MKKIQPPSLKTNNAPQSISTRDVPKITNITGNVYESINVIGKRARQISLAYKEELSGRLAEFGPGIDNLEEVFENREQIEVSRQFERLPKPSLIAIEEFLDKKIQYTKG